MSGSEAPVLTDSLEDYLETVYELVRTKKFARVKDIAQARNVRPGSVSPAMKRLADLGLIQYVRREYISLTPEGEERARRIMARHRLLRRLFEDVLQMPGEAAEEEACSMEHSLSADGMDRLVRFFEFMSLCPEAHDLLQRFHQCDVVTGQSGGCPLECQARLDVGLTDSPSHMTVAHLQPGDRGRVIQVGGSGATRQRLLDMGLMLDAVVTVERVDSEQGSVRLTLHGFQLPLEQT